ncbi:MAG: 8-amino-7-oxononanoate synthase [Planctomycetales bacterium]|nr:8-amino-7-oxononanoate synthase [Planctomycetales bacterium]
MSDQPRQIVWGGPWEWVEEALQNLDRSQLRRVRKLRQSAQTPAAIRWDDRQLVNFSSNDYLGLASDPRLAEAAAAACQQRGWGSGASPAISGRGELHAALESALAEFEGVASALLFPSGYAANIGAVTALAGRGDVIFSDAKNHASIIDGCRLSRADVRVYPHRDVETLSSWLAQPRNGRTLIVTDSLFSMDGCLAPLAEIYQLAEQHGAMLLVDEAHATGVLGDGGRGGCEALGLESAPILRVGTLSKALGSSGGFVAGDARLIDWLFNQARPQFFSTAMPEPVAAASLAALRIVQQEPWRRHDALRRAGRLRAGLTRQGWTTDDEPTQIIPVRVGQPARALQLAQQLLERGFLVPPIRPPSVPHNESLLRISVSSAHTDAHIDGLLAALGSV